MDTTSEICTMFTRRGYENIKQADSIVLNHNEVGILKADYPNPRTPGTVDKVMCLYYISNSSGKSGFTKQSLISLVESQVDPITHILLVCEGITCHVTRYLKSLLVYSEHMYPSEVSSIKLRHKYIPKYRLVDKAELLAIERRYGNRAAYPKLIEHLDPMSRYFNFRYLDIIEITKPSQPNYVMYRIVEPLTSIT
jgi:DNA-directed RNA polymerase subunit H (RpoH/RPB5)